MEFFAPSTDQLRPLLASTSDTLSVPITEALPATAVPASRLPASVTLPALAAALLATTGVSFVPLIVTVTVWSAVAPWSSVTRTT